MADIQVGLREYQAGFADHVLKILFGKHRCRHRITLQPFEKLFGNFDIVNFSVGSHFLTYGLTDHGSNRFSKFSRGAVSVIIAI